MQQEAHQDMSKEPGTRSDAIKQLSDWFLRLFENTKRGFIVLTLLTVVAYSLCYAASIWVGKPAQSLQSHYTYLADAFIHGRLDTDAESVAHLTELVPHEGKLYVVYPPMPAVLLMPFSMIFGPGPWTTPFSILIAGFAVGLTFVMLRRMKFAVDVSVVLAVLLAFGTCYWYSALKGSSWHLASTTGVLFLTWALVETYGARRALLVGFLLGAATLSRLPMVLAAPFFMYELWHAPEKFKVRRVVYFSIGLGAFIAANMLYNWVRYQSIFDVGYAMIPGVLEEPWYAEGILNIRYLPRNLYALFLQPPILTTEFPYFVPSTFGLSLFLTTPAFFMLFLAPGDRKTWIVAATALFCLLPALLHGWPGGTQFGYRWSLDAGPFLLILTAMGMHNRVSGRAYFLVFLSIVICMWGLVYARWIPVQWIFPH